MKLVKEQGKLKLVKDWGPQFYTCKVLIPRKPKRPRDIVYVKGGA